MNDRQRARTVYVSNSEGPPGSAREEDSGARARADHRDQDGQRRDHAADLRDDTSFDRDRAADLRDRLRNANDLLGAAADLQSRAARIPPAFEDLEEVRANAAADRAQAARDRDAGAHDRAHAEGDRGSALADRGAAAADRGHSGTDRRNATVDGLTGVQVRQAGLIALEREMVVSRAAGRSMVLAFVDVDALKAINDSRGHSAGDRTLIGVARALRAVLRSDDLIVRYGGDEFLCVVPGIALEGARERFAQVNLHLAASPDGGSVTVGLAQLLDSDSVNGLIERADIDLYRVRSRPR